MIVVPVKEFESYYTISNSGIITSFWTGIPKVLKNKKDKDGYLYIRLSNGITSKTFKIHRLVASHFIENQENKPQVNHINGVKSDNRFENLEWCTLSENSKHAYIKGLRIPHPKHGDQHPFAKIKNTDIPVIKQRLANNETQASIAKSYGVGHQQISCIKRGITWKGI